MTTDNALVQSVWPLIGRTEELRRAQTAVRGPRAGVVLAGASGVGKSRLSRELLETLSGRYEVRWAAATASARSLPLGVFAEWVPATAGTDPIRQVHAVVNALSASPENRPVIVGVDDAHLVDDLSALVLQQLVDRRAARLVLTVRSGQPAPDAVVGLWKNERVERLEVLPLAREESDRLVARVLGQPPDPPTAHRLWQLTRGNVLFLRHLVEQEREAGRLLTRPGSAVWTGNPVISGTLGELIDAQMGSLSPELALVVDSVAVSEPVDATVLVDVVDELALDLALARGLVRIDHTGRRELVLLGHPLYGEIRRDRTSPARLRRLRGRIASAGGTVAADGPTALVRQALMALDSDLPPDSGLFTAGAGAAMQLLDGAGAARLAGAARVAGGGYDAILLELSATQLIGSPEKVESLVADLDPDEIGIGPWETADLVVRRAANLAYGAGEPARAAEILAAARAELPAACAPVLDAFAAGVDAMAGRLPADTVAGLPDHPELPDFARLTGLCALLTIHASTGDVAAADAVAQRGAQLLNRSAAAAPLVFFLTWHHLRALLLAGRLAAADRIAEQIAIRTVGLPALFGRFAVQLRGHADLAAGRLGTAVPALRRAVDVYARDGSNAFGLIDSRIDLATGLAMSGRADEADAVLTELTAEPNPFPILDPPLLLARAWTAAAQGARTVAVDTARAAAGRAAELHTPAQEVVCLQVATRFGDHGAAARLTELATLVGGPRAGTAAAHARAWAAGDGEGLLASAADAEAGGDRATAIDVAAQAAAVFRRRGLRGSAMSALERAHRLADECAFATPALNAADDRSTRTDRQREIIALVGEGLTNREIAAQLNVSVRTVEGHRYRAARRQTGSVGATPGLA
ncbi:AAA family ATPase [Nocardia sp. NPDC059764]|uniref:helix-turn-helix transcriptional regulator n=1 Tax=Nocardia sp. NPDC059764 TaxID=3346939 RepID=UPI0036609639